VDMVERTYLKSEVSEAQIREALQRWNPEAPWMLEDCGDTWKVILMEKTPDDVDAIFTGIQSYPDLTITYWATVTELRQAVKPICVTRGKYVFWCYVTPTMADRFKAGTSKIGDKVLVVFADGDRDLPVVIG